MKAITLLMKKKLWLFLGLGLVVLFLVKWLWNKISNAIASGKGFWAFLSTRSNAETSANAARASDNPVVNSNAPIPGEPIDKTKVEGVVSTIKEAFGWNDDEDEMISALNTLSNGTEVKYASELYKTLYGHSLRAKVSATLNTAEKARVKVLVQTNWY